MKWTPRDWIAVMLCATVCLCIFMPVLVAMCYPPGTIAESVRIKLLDNLDLMIGIISGYLLSGIKEPKE